MSIPKKFCLMWDNYFDLATLTALATDAGYDVGYLQNRWLERKWLSATLTNWIKANLGTADLTARVLIIKNHNFSCLAAGDYALVQANVADAWPGAVNSTLTVVDGTIVKFWAKGQKYQWWRVPIIDSVNPDSYIQAGRIFIGPFTQLSYNPEKISRPRKDLSEIQKSTGGNVSVDIKTKPRTYHYSWSALPKTDIDNLDSIFQTIGQGLPLFICEDPQAPIGKTFYVHLISDFDPQPVAQDWWSLVLTFEDEV